MSRRFYFNLKFCFIFWLVLVDATTNTLTGINELRVKDVTAGSGMSGEIVKDDSGTLPVSEPEGEVNSEASDEKPAEVVGAEKLVEELESETAVKSKGKEWRKKVKARMSRFFGRLTRLAMLPLVLPVLLPAMALTAAIHPKLFAKALSDGLRKIGKSMYRGVKGTTRLAYRGAKGATGLAFMGARGLYRGAKGVTRFAYRGAKGTAKYAYRGAKGATKFVYTGAKDAASTVYRGGKDATSVVHKGAKGVILGDEAKGKVAEEE